MRQLLLILTLAGCVSAVPGNPVPQSARLSAEVLTLTLSDGTVCRANWAAAPAGRDLLTEFRAAFYPRPVAAQDSFESLEGDSLAYVQVSLAVEARLGRLPAAGLALALGIAIEGLQAMLGRSASLPDLVADLAGIALVAVLWPRRRAM